ncbi:MULTISPECIES: helix-turn-helix domain-containing protein [Bradyrhizobium]|uniref:helix-turn-helix domain-containing protein n=1 Tax=Bradyrhizobium TaxID=374 RepID=UPI00094332C4|nr:MULTISPECIES: helix-turn-helix domain-containing protein [Bradyrhizobium]
MTVELLDKKEAAKRLKITEDQLAGLVEDGEISYINTGRGKKRPRRRFTEKDLEEFVERRRRRESCLSTSPKNHRSTNTISGSGVIGFTARRNAQIAKTPKNSKR